MMTYVKYFYSSEFVAKYIYGYISGYVNDKDGTPLVVIVTQDNTLQAIHLGRILVVSEQEYMDNASERSSY
jgi:hypothetical protein